MLWHLKMTDELNFLLQIWRNSLQKVAYELPAIQDLSQFNQKRLMHVALMQACPGSSARA